MAEAALNARLLKALKGYHAHRVENPVYPGTPDINYTGGWIESKWLPRWPRKGNVVKVDHFTTQQRLWHKMRSTAGGVSYVIIQIERTVLVFRGYDAAVSLGNVDEDALRKMAVAVWENFIPPADLIAAIVTE